MLGVSREKLVLVYYVAGIVICVLYPLSQPKSNVVVQLPMSYCYYVIRDIIPMRKAYDIVTVIILLLKMRKLRFREAHHNHAVGKGLGWNFYSEFRFLVTVLGHLFMTDEETQRKPCPRRVQRLMLLAAECLYLVFLYF